MTKKKQAAFDAAIAKRDMHAAMWIGERPPGPDIPPPGYQEPDTRGWDLSYTGTRVIPCGSSQIYHWHSESWPPIAPQIKSQQPQALYSSKVAALRMCRYLRAVEFAGKLAKFDAQIKAELAADLDRANG